MSHYLFDRSFHPGMSRTLLSLTTDFRMDNRIVPWDELTGSDTIMNELAHHLRRSGWPERTYVEVRKELLRLHERWKKVVVPKSETFRRILANNPSLWIEESEDEDDIFMPPLPGSASLKGKSSSSSKGKVSSSSKGKSYSSSKGKSSASMEDDDDDFM
ncbi:hypothetical protein VPH35_087958 [Triticum aestivum]